MKRGFQRRAEFVWRPRGLEDVKFSTAAPRLPQEANRFLYLRHSFDIDGPVHGAEVFATADGRYQIFVNGVLVGRGPARSGAAYRNLDPIDLAPLLKTGRNVIAILAHSYGRNTAWYELPGWDYARAFGCGGFFLQGDLLADSGGEQQTLKLDTDARWRCLEAAAWRREVPSNSLGFAEIFDARLAPPDWTAVEFDDSAWAHAEVLRVAGRNYTGDVRPFQYLLPRDIPAQRVGPLVAARAIAWAEVQTAADVGDGGDLAAQMESEPSQPLANCRVNEAGDLVETSGSRAVSMVYDFGEIVAGYIRFELDGPAGAVVDFYPGEQLHADGRVRIFDGIPGFDTPVAHRYVLREGLQTWERFEWNGLRYLQVSYRHCSTPLRVHAVAVNRTGYPVQPHGRFDCSDPALTRIWQAGARTLQLCMHDAYVDCPSREQRQWMDAYVDARINYAAFGDSALAARLIRQIAESQRPEGLTMMAAPGDFALAGFTNIPDFCLYWILTIGDYLLYADDPQIVDDVYPSVARALQWFERQLNDENLLTDVPHWVFVEWAETDKKGQVTALNALYVGALRAAAEIARRVEHARAAAHYDTLAQQVCDAVNRLLWDEERGVYADARRNGRLSRRISQQSNAAAIAFGVAPQARWARIWTTILDPRRLVLTYALGSDGKVTPFDESVAVVQAQPFFSHFLHRALRMDGQAAAIVDNIRSRWSELLADGAVTLRETWQLDPITSKCHAWSATPTFDLSTDILGVCPLTSGFRRLRVAPQLLDLKWARGSFPTPRGELLVAWTHEAGRLEIEVGVPEGCTAEIVCPLPGGWQRPDGAAAGQATIVVGAGCHRVVAGDAV